MYANCAIVQQAEYNTTGLRFWSVRFTPEFLQEVWPAPLPEYNPQNIRPKRRESVVTRFVDVPRTGEVHPGMVAYLTEAWWNEMFPDNTTFKTFKDSRAHVFSFTLGEVSGLLPRSLGPGSGTAPHG
jgi:hypothetical protein